MIDYLLLSSSSEDVAMCVAVGLRAAYLAATLMQAEHSTSGGADRPCRYSGQSTAAHVIQQLVLFQGLSVGETPSRRLFRKDVGFSLNYGSGLAPRRVLTSYITRHRRLFLSFAPHFVCLD